MKTLYLIVLAACLIFGIAAQQPAQAEEDGIGWFWGDYYWEDDEEDDQEESDDGEEGDEEFEKDESDDNNDEYEEE